MDGHYDWGSFTVRMKLLSSRHPGGAGPQAGAGGVEVAVSPVGSNLPLVVAVVLTPLTVGALPPALLQAVHLPDEVHGEVRALAVSGLAPPGDGAGGLGGEEGEAQYQDPHCELWSLQTVVGN